MKHACSLHDRRDLAAALLLAGLLVLALPLQARAADATPAGTASRLVLAQSAAPAAAPETHNAATASAAEHNDSWMPTISKAFNFAVLVAILVYFLKSPTVTYLQTRSAAIRRELDEAAALRTSAERQLAEIRAKLAGLPAELDALRTRGQDELAGERIRLAEATRREKERLLEQTRREIDLQSRVARRELLEHVADLAMRLTREAIERDMTPADQARLIDRYAAEVHA